ncbi:hypothetical protein GGH92_004155 [Coemansia sp. RSA 2673]|nr:hypothetical protein GGH92_004155 [Coemansia sp. RSA 2673]
MLATFPPRFDHWEAREILTSLYCKDPDQVSEHILEFDDLWRYAHLSRDNDEMIHLYFLSLQPALRTMVFYTTNHAALRVDWTVTMLYRITRELKSDFKLLTRGEHKSTHGYGNHGRSRQQDDSRYSSWKETYPDHSDSRETGRDKPPSGYSQYEQCDDRTKQWQGTKHRSCSEGSYAGKYHRNESNDQYKHNYQQRKEESGGFRLHHHSDHMDNARDQHTFGGKSGMTVCQVDVDMVKSDDESFDGSRDKSGEPSVYAYVVNIHEPASSGVESDYDDEVNGDDSNISCCHIAVTTANLTVSEPVQLPVLASFCNSTPGVHYDSSGFITRVEQILPTPASLVIGPSQSGDVKQADGGRSVGNITRRQTYGVQTLNGTVGKSAFVLNPQCTISYKTLQTELSGHTQSGVSSRASFSIDVNQIDAIIQSGNTASNSVLKPQVSEKTKVHVATFVDDKVGGKIGGGKLITPADHSKWIIPARVHVGDSSQDIQVLLDSGATHSVISHPLAEELGCIINKLPGLIHTAKVGVSYPRIGQTEVMITTSRHAFRLLVEIFPGAIDPPLFFGVEVLNHFATSSLMSVLLDRADHPLAFSEEPDIDELPPDDDSMHRAAILTKLADVV